MKIEIYFIFLNHS